MLFLGDSFVVTVRHGKGRALSDVRRQLEHNKGVLEAGPSAVLYAVADRIVDDYSQIVLEIEEDIEEVEERVFSPERGNSAARIYNLKREVIEFRRAVAPLVEPMKRLASGEEPHVDDQMAPFFRDIADHVLRVGEQVDWFDDLLASVLNANLAQVAVQQNEDMRRISAWVAMAAVPTADRRHLRDELRPHARAGVELRLPRRDRVDGDHLCAALPRLPAQRLALTGSTTSAVGVRFLPFRPGRMTCSTAKSRSSGSP